MKQFEVVLEAKRVFNGVMLGDGGLVLPRTSDNAHFYMALANGRLYLPTDQLLCYLAGIASCLELLDVPVSNGYPKIVEKTSHGKPYMSHELLTRTSSFLTRERNRWHIKGIKEVPEDLVLTPVSLAHWFMNDGSSPRQGSAVYASFATYSFSEHSIELLEHQLASLSIQVNRGKNKQVVKGSGLRLFVQQAKVNLFMSIIEPYVVEPFRYKIKYRE